MSGFTILTPKQRIYNAIVTQDLALVKLLIEQYSYSDKNKLHEDFTPVVISVSDMNVLEYFMKSNVLSYEHSTLWGDAGKTVTQEMFDRFFELGLPICDSDRDQFVAGSWKNVLVNRKVFDIIKPELNTLKQALHTPNFPDFKQFSSVNVDCNIERDICDNETSPHIIDNIYRFLEVVKNIKLHVDDFNFIVREPMHVRMILNRFSGMTSCFTNCHFWTRCKNDTYTTLRKEFIHVVLEKEETKNELLKEVGLPMTYYVCRVSGCRDVAYRFLDNSIDELMINYLKKCLEHGSYITSIIDDYRKSVNCNESVYFHEKSIIFNIQLFSIHCDHEIIEGTSFAVVSLTDTGACELVDEWKEHLPSLVPKKKPCM